MYTKIRIRIFQLFNILFALGVLVSPWKQVQAQENYGTAIIGYDCMVESGDVVEAADVFPLGVDVVAVSFPYQNIPNATVLTVRVYNNSFLQKEWQSQIQGSRNFCITEAADEVGNWRIDFIVDGNVVTQSAWSVINAPMVTRIKTGTDVLRKDGLIVGEATSFPSGTHTVFVSFVRWNMPETLVHIMHNGEIFRTFTNNDDHGAWIAIRTQLLDAAITDVYPILPDGEYLVEFEYNGVVLTSHHFYVGS